MSGDGGTAPDPVDAVDARLAAIDPTLPVPAVTRRDVVLVTGPWLAGTTSVVAALRQRLPERGFVESAELSPGEAPVAVVFVVSAGAPVSESDRALLDAAASHTDAVIGVVSKIDVHRIWREVLDTNRAALAGHASRYAEVAWVGVAAAPDLGLPNVDELVARLRAVLTDSALERRNRLRAWERQLDLLGRRYVGDVEGLGRRARLDVLTEQRSAALRRRGLVRSQHTVAVHSQLQQARVQLSYFARNRCASVRSELQQDAAEMTRRKLGGFDEYVHRRVADVVDQVDQGVTERLADVVGELGLTGLDIPGPVTRPVDVPALPLRSRRLETRLMTALGAGFGLGVALTLSRLLADLPSGWAMTGAAGCAVLGVLLTLWVVSARGLLHDRAVLDRWVAEVTAELRAAVEERVVIRMLAAEPVLGRAAADRDAAAIARVEDEVARIDGDIRAHARAAARAATARDQHLPGIARALAMVRADLGERVLVRAPRAGRRTGDL